LNVRDIITHRKFR